MHTWLLGTQSTCRCIFLRCPLFPTTTTDMDLDLSGFWIRRAHTTQAGVHAGHARPLHQAQSLLRGAMPNSLPHAPSPCFCSISWPHPQVQLFLLWKNKPVLPHPFTPSPLAPLSPDTPPSESALCGSLRLPSEVGQLAATTSYCYVLCLLHRPALLLLGSNRADLLLRH